jgi:hypothetical protein
MAQEARVALRLAVTIANAPTMPEWLPRSEFKRQTGSSPQ